MTSGPNDLPYPDFLIRCTGHGGSDRGTIEAKFRWEGVEWLPVYIRGKLNVVSTHLRGNSVDDWWSVAIDDNDADIEEIPIDFRRPKDAPALREKYEINCGARNCRNRIPVPKDALQFAFMATVLAVRQASKPGLGDWIYKLAELPAGVDRERGVVTYTFDGLRVALAYTKSWFGVRTSHARFGRHVGQ
ncbi:hypothetical protein MSIMFI_03800 [Mycobacterium simulans]|nr:hypothetical protein MSIMFI_03800 [Mycobacterium simulans]